MSAPVVDAPFAGALAARASDALAHSQTAPPSGSGPASLLEIVTFRGGYNTNVVLTGVTLLGLAAGVIGAFAMLRRRTLVADALGHAALPGVAAAFLAGSAAGLAGRSLPLLLAGAALSGLLAATAIELLVRRTRLTPDTATAAVLASSFGLGVALLGVAQRAPGGGQAGLGHLVFGRAAGMLRADALWMSGLAVAALAAGLALGRAFAGVAFSERFARTAGLPVRGLDAALAALIAVVTLAGLQAVGMLLVVALLAAPAAAARLWSTRVRTLVALAGALGALSGFAGTALSAALPDAPTGAVITLAASALFALSLLASPRRGVVAVALRRRALRRRVLAALSAPADPAHPGSAEAAP